MDHSKRVTAIETAMAADMEKTTGKSEKAAGEMQKLKEAIDGKGPVKICIYVMIILGICGMGYLMFCTKDSSCGV